MNKKLNEFLIDVMVLLLHSLFLCLMLDDEWNLVLYITNWLFLTIIIAFFRWKGRTNENIKELKKLNEILVKNNEYK